MQLVIARPSPFARKVRVALLEKGLPFETVVENPWLPETVVENPWLPETRIRAMNPLGKVPALILDDGQVVHDSKVIVEYLETLDAPPRLIPTQGALRVAHKQIEALADGICDAVVLIALEGARPEAMRSRDWLGRQHHKVESGVAELSRLLGTRGWFTEAGFGLAEIATICALEYLDFRYPAFDWRSVAPNLLALHGRLAGRSSFAETKPAPQVLPVLG